MIVEYELVKARKHHRFKFVSDFYAHHGTNRQTFAKYYNRHKRSGTVTYNTRTTNTNHLYVTTVCSHGDYGVTPITTSLPVVRIGT